MYLPVRLCLAHKHAEAQANGPCLAVQFVQGAPEPGGHQAAGGNGRLCPRVPGTFGQPAGEHADQDQSRRWVNLILLVKYLHWGQWWSRRKRCLSSRPRGQFNQCDEQTVCLTSLPPHVTPLCWKRAQISSFNNMQPNQIDFFAVEKLYGPVGLKCHARHRDLQGAVLGVREEQVRV